VNASSPDMSIFRHGTVADCSFKQLDLTLRSLDLAPFESSTDMPQVYSGESECLVIAFDVGTTYSGACVSWLKPGQEAKSHPVTP
jgi:hypothetical protein